MIKNQFQDYSTGKCFLHFHDLIDHSFEYPADNTHNICDTFAFIVKHNVNLPDWCIFMILLFYM